MAAPKSYGAARKEAAMLFLVAGVLKQGVEQRLLDLHNEWNEHLSQPDRKLSLFGALRDKAGKRVGYLALLEGKDFEEAESFLAESPFYQNDLYERVEVAEFSPEVGEIK
jgi:uncharacterized protein YciI